MDFVRVVEPSLERIKVEAHESKTKVAINPRIQI